MIKEACWWIYTAVVVGGFIIFGVLAAMQWNSPAEAATLSTDPAHVDQIVKAQPNSCQQRELRAALATVPDTGFEWVWASLSKEAGRTWSSSGTVALATATPCEYIADVVLHEWMHTAGAVGAVDHYEVVADCGAVVLMKEYGHGLVYTHYADEVGGCTPEENQVASDIIKNAA
jgi:hypothetical protein